MTARTKLGASARGTPRVPPEQGGSGGGGLDFTFVFTAVSIAANSGEMVIVTGGVPLTITLPPAPAVGDSIIVKGGSGLASGAAPITVDGNGNTIDGTATKNITTAYGAFWLIYTGAEWSLI